MIMKLLVPRFLGLFYGTLLAAQLLPETVSAVKVVPAAQGMRSTRLGGPAATPPIPGASHFLGEEFLLPLVFPGVEVDETSPAHLDVTPPARPPSAASDYVLDEDCHSHLFSPRPRSSNLLWDLYFRGGGVEETETETTDLIEGGGSGVEDESCCSAKTAEGLYGEQRRSDVEMTDMDHAEGNGAAAVMQRAVELLRCEGHDFFRQPGNDDVPAVVVKDVENSEPGLLCDGHQAVTRKCDLVEAGEGTEGVLEARADNGQEQLLCESISRLKQLNLTEQAFRALTEQALRDHDEEQQQMPERPAVVSRRRPRPESEGPRSNDSTTAAVCPDCDEDVPSSRGFGMRPTAGRSGLKKRCRVGGAGTYLQGGCQRATVVVDE